MTKQPYEEYSNDAPYTNLALAVVEQAVKDYIRAYKRNDKNVIISLEYFFNSEWFTTLTDLDGKYIIKEVKRICQEEKNRQKQN